MADISRGLEILNHEIVWKEALLKNKDKECAELLRENKNLQEQVNSLIAENIALKVTLEQKEGGDQDCEK